MVKAITRRNLLVSSSIVFSTLAGCQSIQDSNVPIQTHILNLTNKSQDVYIELTHFESEQQQVGRVFSVENDSAKSFSFSVPSATYRLKVIIDDVEPQPRETLRWEVADDDCSKNTYGTISPSDEGLNLQLMAENCENVE